MTGSTSTGSFSSNCIYRRHTNSRGDVAPVHDGSEVPVVVATRLRRPRSPELWKTTMFAMFRRKAPKPTYTWKPALDLTDPRVSAILKTFGWA